MPPHNLGEILNNIASEEIADDMNLWPEIHAKLEKIPAPRARPMLGLGRAVAAFAIILFAGTVYAVYQAVSRNGDPGIQAVSELITEIGQTLEWAPEDVNVTLDWGYADGHRIVIGWTVDFPYDLDLPMPTVTMLDRNGTPLKDAAFLYGGGGGGGGDGDRIRFSSTNSFDATGIAGTPETLPLTVHFTFGQLLDSASSGGSGGGSGGGGGGSTEMPPKRTLSEPFRLMFDFELPFIPAVPVQGEFSKEAAGVTIRITDISYAPSITLATMCYTLESERMYVPAFSALGLSDLSVMFFSEQTAPDENGQICGGVSSFRTANAKTGIIDLSVHYLQTYWETTEENVALLKAQVEEAGLPFLIELIPTDENPEGTVGMRVEYLREGRDTYAEDYTALDALQQEIFIDTIDGPWVFHIEVK